MVEALSTLSLASEDAFLVGFSLFGIPDRLLGLEFVHGILVINPNVLVEGALKCDGSFGAARGMCPVKQERRFSRELLHGEVVRLPYLVGAVYPRLKEWEFPLTIPRSIEVFSTDPGN